MMLNADCLAVTHAKATATVPTTAGRGKIEYHRGLEGLRGIQYVILVGHLAGGYALCRPLVVSVTPDDNGTHVASSSVFPVHGDAASPEAAIADLRLCLAEYYDLVREGALGGDAYDQREYARLRVYITRHD